MTPVTWFGGVMVVVGLQDRGTMVSEMVVIGARLHDSLAA